MTALPARLSRETFATSRLLEFCSRRELVSQTGHSVEQWPLVILKELIDNALDDAEESSIAPHISIAVRRGLIIVADNGSGMKPEVVKSILDYQVRVSSREAYVSPTRGAQGNALKTILAMPFALSGTKGETVIEARGIAHRIIFTVDHVRQEPRITHTQGPSDVRNGTRITAQWPASACSKPADAKGRFLQIADAFGWLNPHLTMEIDWEGERTRIVATDPAWTKWKPSDPTSPHWYDVDRLTRLMGAYIARDQDRGREPRTVREFISEFRGLAGTAKQKAVLDAIGAARVTLPAFFGIHDVNRPRIAKLLETMQRHTRPVKPRDLGIIGGAHLRRRVMAAGADDQTFRYFKQFAIDSGLPHVIECAFGYCPKGTQREIVTGVNWSPGIINPIRELGRFGQSLDTVLTEQRAGNSGEPVTLMIHMTCPRVEYTDRGKSALALAGSISAQDVIDEEDDGR
jgi:DNA topoisomerase VI subunit B